MADDRPVPDLYDRDFYAWTQVQADALRAGVAGSNVIDWARLAEEIEGVGSAERNAVRSHLRQIIIHLFKLETSRARRPRAHWRIEIAEHRAQIEPRITASIRREVEEELDAMHRKAADQAQLAIDSFEIGLTVDGKLRWTLGQLLGEVGEQLPDLSPREDEG